MKYLVSAVAAAAAMTAAAQAATFHTTTAGFAANGVGGCASGCNYQDYLVDGRKLRVSAGLYSDPTAVGDAVVWENRNDAEPRVFAPGTGLDHDGGNGLPDDREHYVDGNNGNEVLIFRFDHVVQLISALFTYVERDDEFDLFIDSNDDGILERVARRVDIPGGDLADLTAFSLIGKMFGIGAGGSDDEWKLKALTVRDITDVPLPAALPLFLAGMAGFGFAGRKRRAQRS